jgi:methylmalonyl-CoA epimerase
MQQNLSFDHIGIAVKSIDSALSLYRDALGYKVSSQETVQEQGVKVCFLDTGSTAIELLEPLPGCDGPLSRFLAKKGEALHHVCFGVADIKAEVLRFEKLGYRLIDSTPRKGAHNTLVAFLHPASTFGTLVELCQYR